MRAREGFAFLVRERDIAITLGGAVAALALFSISATAEPFFVTDVLGAGSLAYGVLLTSWTLGMAAGSAGLAHRVGRTRLAVGGLVAIVLQGLGIAGGALSPVVWLALIGFAFGGMAHGVKNVLLRTLIPERAPNANAYAERFVRSIKEECLDRIIPIGERHFRHAITEFVEHYHRERNHQGLDNRLIAGTPVTDGTGRVRCRRRLGGLLNFYERAA